MTVFTEQQTNPLEKGSFSANPTNHVKRDVYSNCSIDAQYGRARLPPILRRATMFLDNRADSGRQPARFFNQI
jgi:hypothetical protein